MTVFCDFDHKDGRLPPYNPGNSESTRLNALIPGLFLFGGMLRFTAIRKLSKNQKIELKNFQFLLEKSNMKSTFSYSNVKLRFKNINDTQWAKTEK